MLTGKQTPNRLRQVSYDIDEKELNSNRPMFDPKGADSCDWDYMDAVPNMSTKQHMIEKKSSMDVVSGGTAISQNISQSSRDR
jgi:hypothetical protein